MLASGSLVVLLPTLYFTFGRGAWIALGAGLLVAAAASAQPIRFAAHAAVLALPAIVGILVASRLDGLTMPGAPLEVAVEDGRRLALVLVACLVGAVALPVLLERMPGDARLRPGVRRAVLAVAAAVALAALVAGALRAEEAYRSFTEDRGAVDSGGSERLLTLSGSGRAEYWRVAWGEFRQHPALGSGSGTFDLYWARDRSNSFGALDAHNLYLEKLAEVGPLGLLLLLAGLAAPLAALPYARGEPLAAAAAGPYVAYLVHAGADWDWELPTVTLTGLLCGAGVVVAARSEKAHRVGRVPRAAALTAVAVLAVVAVVGQAGNSALRRSLDARQSGDVQQADEQAQAATRWAPWSSRAWIALASAERSRGETPKALESLGTAVAKDPFDWRPWLELALVTTGESRRQALARASELNPRSPVIAALRGESDVP
jgi:hypothetical protein